MAAVQPFGRGGRIRTDDLVLPKQAESTPPPASMRETAGREVFTCNISAGLCNTPPGLLRLQCGLYTCPRCPLPTEERHRPGDPNSCALESLAQPAQSRHAAARRPWSMH